MDLCCTLTDANKQIFNSDGRRQCTGAREYNILYNRPRARARIRPYLLAEDVVGTNDVVKGIFAGVSMRRLLHSPGHLACPRVQAGNIHGCIATCVNCVKRYAFANAHST